MKLVLVLAITLAVLTSVAWFMWQPAALQVIDGPENLQVTIRPTRIAWLEARMVGGGPGDACMHTAIASLERGNEVLESIRIDNSCDISQSLAWEGDTVVFRTSVAGDSATIEWNAGQ